jgi:hypothetical protein
MKLHKVDIAINDSTEDITYRQTRNYYFQPDLSMGKESDMVTIPNVPLFVSIYTNNCLSAFFANVELTYIREWPNSRKP